MGTLLATILSISMVTGCGHTTSQAGTNAVNVRVAPWNSTAAVETSPTPSPSGAELAVVPQPAPKPPEPRTPRRGKSERWIPEKVTPQQYLNSGGFAPHQLSMGWRR